MWQIDEKGTEFEGTAAALKALRARAQRAILEGDAHGFDVRGVRIRIRNEDGDIIFEGTTEEAARLVIDG